MQSIYALLLSTLLNNIPQTSKNEDLVKLLPKYEYNGTLYSGYLSASPRKQFHYLLHLADTEHDSKPLVLWLNGGPGCSSLYGWITENGPMMYHKNKTFSKNEYSWNKEANMLYIESPGEVGFSFINSNLDSDLEINDDITAKENFNALLSFFLKFPEYKGREFYISGESYAGVYIPMLAYEIINYNKLVPEDNRINLKGILVGNGLADNDCDDITARLDYAFSHHFMSYETRLKYIEYCIKNFTNNPCLDIIHKSWNLLDKINIYNIYEDCDLPTTTEGEIDYYSNYFIKSSWTFKDLKVKQNMMRSKIRLLSEEEGDVKLQCFNDKFMTDYFNDDEVKKNLHVNMTKHWGMCSNKIFKNYKTQYKASIWAYPTLIKNNIRILIFNGDADLSVPFNGNIRWIESLKLDVEEPWRKWRAFGEKNNISGYVTKYKGLTFCTVKGAGHEVPRYRPKEAYYMFKQFLNNEKL